MVKVTVTDANGNTLTSTGAIDAGGVGYTPAVNTDWDSDTDPGDLDDALDQLAERVDDLEIAGSLYTAYAILRDEKATTTDGGATSATTWNARDVNTEVVDADNIVTISSNQFTPIAGDFEIHVIATIYSAQRNRLRLYNVTGTASVKEGESCFAASASNSGTLAHLSAKFTANGTHAYRIDHYTEAANAAGKGASTDDGSNEVYMTIVLRKLA